MSTDDELSTEYIDQMIARGVFKRCPGCGILIFKDDGCNYVACPCGTEMCWLHHLRKGPAPGECPFGNPLCNSH